tara:strand:- start:83 stop:244 length:162 start_codon:yes stop_codon:yes gene_type:complete
MRWAAFLSALGRKNLVSGLGSIDEIMVNLHGIARKYRGDVARVKGRGRMRGLK